MCIQIALMIFNFICLGSLICIVRCTDCLCAKPINDHPDVSYAYGYYVLSDIHLLPCIVYARSEISGETVCACTVLLHCLPMRCVPKFHVLSQFVQFNRGVHLPKYLISKELLKVCYLLSYRRNSDH